MWLYMFESQFVSVTKKKKKKKKKITKGVIIKGFTVFIYETYKRVNPKP
jgi:hypothetical protein